MKNFAIITAVVLTVAACSSTPKVEDYTQGTGKIANAEFLEKNGPLTLQFDDKGNWISIKSSATAPLVNNAPEGVEIAFKTATMRAKRNLIEFLSNDVRSTKSVQTISKSYLKNIAQTNNANQTTTGGEEDDASNSQASKQERQKANTIAQTVRERLDDNAQFILKGVEISSRGVVDDHVAVTIMVTPKGIRAADQVRKAMGGV